MLATSIIGLVASIGVVALRRGTLGTFEDLSIGIPKLNSDVSHFFISEANRLHSRNSFNQGGFTVSHMSDGTDVDGCLS